jgi:hypothetical protein
VPRLDDIDFEPARPPIFILVLFVVLYGLLGLALASEAAYQLGRGPEGAFGEVAAGGAAYVLGAALVVYWERAAWRIRFGEDGLRILTWRGRRSLPWASVTSATLYHYRGAYLLDLWSGRFRVVVVPLYGWRRQDRLLEEIRARVPVEIRGYRPIAPPP